MLCLFAFTALLLVETIFVEGAICAYDCKRDEIILGLNLFLQLAPTPTYHGIVLPKSTYRLRHAKTQLSIAEVRSDIIVE